MAKVTKKVTKKRVRKNVERGQAHIQASFNNTIVTLTDAQGNTISFENTIIIMTSNAGSNTNTNSIGFGGSSVSKNKILESLKETFRPEFLNRIDEIVLFEQLTPEQLLQITDLML